MQRAALTKHAAVTVIVVGDEPQEESPEGVAVSASLDGLLPIARTRTNPVLGEQDTESERLELPNKPENVTVRGLTAQIAFGVVEGARTTDAYEITRSEAIDATNKICPM